MSRTRGDGTTTARLFAWVLLAASVGGLTVLSHAAESRPSERRFDREIEVVLSGYSMPPDRLMYLGGGRASQKTSGSFWLSASAYTSCLMGWASHGPATSDRPHSAELAASWTFEGRVLSIERDTATIDLRWERDVRQPGLSPGSSFEQHATLTLREDEAMPIDLVRVLPEAGFECGHYVVELGFDFVESPEVADARLDYDLWLVHREPDGGQVTERVRVGGDQGAEVEYGFAPLWHGTDGALLDVEREGALRTTISGELKGRARPDGMIDLRLEAERWVSAELKPGTRGSLGGGSGVKYFTVNSGETIEIVLPPAHGTFGLRGGGKEESLDLSRIFAGATTALRVTASRVR